MTVCYVSYRTTERMGKMVVNECVRIFQKLLVACVNVASWRLLRAKGKLSKTNVGWGSRFSVYIQFEYPPNFLPSFQTALQPGVYLGLLYNMPAGFSIPCSISPPADTHLSQVRGHVMWPSHSRSSSLSCSI